NSVTGRILQDFAVDIGLSPDLTVLTEQAEQQAFALAVDDIIAGAEQEYRQLFIRTGYDLSDDETSRFNASRKNWSATIRQIITLARSNDLDAKQFPEFANQSIAELQALLGSATDVDQRTAVVTGLRSAVQDIRHQIDSGEIKGRSINPCEGWIAATQQVLTRIEREGL